MYDALFFIFFLVFFFFFQAEDGIRDSSVTGVQTCALPIFARRSSSVRPSRFSRRSNSPAQSDDRSGSEPMSAAERSPSSARTRTASSRYVWATRTGETLTPPRPTTSCQSLTSPAPPSPYHQRPPAPS